MMGKRVTHLGTGIYSTSLGATAQSLWQDFAFAILMDQLCSPSLFPTEAAYRLTLDYWLKWLGITAFVITSSSKAEFGSHFYTHKYIYKAPCGRKGEKKSRCKQAEESSYRGRNLQP